MENECRTFVEKLLENHEAIEGDPKSLQHLKVCARCSEIYEKHNEKIRELKVAFKLDTKRKHELFARISQNTIQINTENKEPYSSVIEFFFRLKGLVAVAFLIAFFFSIVYFFQPSMTRKKGFFINGSGKISKGNRTFDLSEGSVKISPREIVRLLDGDLRVFYGKQYLMNISGVIDLFFDDNLVAVKNGKAIFKFKPVGEQIKLESRCFQVEISGTKIRYEGNELIESLSVIEGKINWSLKDRQNYSVMNPGQGVRARQKNDGSFTIVEQFSFFPGNEIFEASGSMNFKNTGKGWKPDEN